MGGVSASKLCDKEKQTLVGGITVGEAWTNAKLGCSENFAKTLRWFLGRQEWQFSLTLRAAEHLGRQVLSEKQMSRKSSPL